MIDSSSVLVLQSPYMSDVGDEVVLLDTGSTAYYGADAVGAHVLRLLKAPTRVSELVASVTARFDVSPEVCTRDLLVFLAELEREGLVVVGDE